MKRFIVPMVEVELAFILGKRLEGDAVTIFDVLSGSFTRPLPVAAGDTVHAGYGALGSISCRFV